MNKKFLIFLVVFMVLIFSCFCIYFVSGILKDRKAIEEKLVDIKLSSDLMNSSINEFNIRRGRLNSWMGDVTLNKFGDDYEMIIFLLKEEEKYVNEAYDHVVKLDGNCNGRMYTDATANKTCLIYKINYEEMVNVFVSDVSSVNDMIQKHNEKYSPLDTYTTTYQYIDYNKDGNYSGRTSS